VPRITELLANGLWRTDWCGGLVSLYEHDPRPRYALGYEPAPMGRAEPAQRPSPDRCHQPEEHHMSRQNINRVTLTGNLTADPDHRPGLEGQTSRTRLRLAVHERVRNRDSGEYEERPNYIDVTVWGNSADACAEYLKTGSKVGVDGRLRWHEWHPEEGATRQTIEVVADSVEFLGTRRATPERPLVGATAAAGAPAHGDLPDEDIPF